MQFSGTNDFSSTSVTTPAIQQAIVATELVYQTETVRENIALGARNHVFINLPDLGTFLSPGSGSVASLASQGSAQVNAGMLANLTALHQQSGVNIHYVANVLLVNEIRANPLAYGFSVAGVKPNTVHLGI